MRPVRAFGWMAVLAAAAWTGCTRDNGGAPPDIVMPLAVDSDQVLGYLVVPSLEKVLGDVEAIGELFSAPEMGAKALKAKIGAPLGDPGLEHLDLARPIVVLFFKPAQPTPVPGFAAFLPAREGAPYEKAIEGMGMVSRFSGGLVLAGQTPDALAMAAGMKGFYDEIARTNIASSARLYMDIGRLLETYGPLVEAHLDKLIAFISTLEEAKGPTAEEEPAEAREKTGMPPGYGPWMETILRAEYKGALAFLRQCDVVQMGIDIDRVSKSLDGNATIVAKPGTALADFFGKSAARRPSADSLVEAGGMLAAAGSLDAKSLVALVEGIIGELSKDPRLAKLLTPDIKALYTEMGDWWGGAYAGTMRATQDGTFVIDYVMDVLDADGYIRYMEKSWSMLAPGTTLGDFYKAMGVEFSGKLERDVRQHDGVPIHRIATSWDFVGKHVLGKEEAAFMESVLGPWEMAIVNGLGLTSQDPGGLDSMIDRVKSGKRLKLDLAASRAFGPGRHGYMDIDFVGFMKGAMSMPGDEQSDEIRKVFAGLPSGAPMLFAATFAEKRGQFQVRLPLEPFSKLSRK